MTRIEEAKKAVAEAPDRGAESRRSCVDAQDRLRESGGGCGPNEGPYDDGTMTLLVAAGALLADAEAEMAVNKQRLADFMAEIRELMGALR